MNAACANQVGLTVFCARAGDHNALAMAGAISLGCALSVRLGIPAETIGEPDTALNAAWGRELAMAVPALSALAEHLDTVFAHGLAPLTAMNRCAASLATLPVVMRHRPDACVVWLDAHGDLNTPQTTLTGYLGGMSLAGPGGLWHSGLGNGLPLANIVLVGARVLDPAEQMLIKSGRVKLIPRNDNHLSELRNAVGETPVYIHIDCDVLEPGIVPTDYRVPGGFTLAELHGICEVLAGNELVGLEIAEFEDTWHEGGPRVSPDPLLDALDPVISRLGEKA